MLRRGAGGGLSPPHCPSSSHSSHLPHTHTASTPTVRCPPLLTPSPQFSLCFSISPVRGRRRHPEFVTATQALTRLFSPPCLPCPFSATPVSCVPEFPVGCLGEWGPSGREEQSMGRGILESFGHSVRKCFLSTLGAQHCPVMGNIKVNGVEEMARQNYKSKGRENRDGPESKWSAQKNLKGL